MRTFLNRKTTWLVIALALLICVGATGKVHAYTHDTISDIEVPRGVTWGAQVEWQGHAITKVTKQGNLYIVEVARDSEPHELPYFSISFDLNWNYIGTVRTFNPAVEKRLAEEAKRAEEDKVKQQQAEQDRIRKEEEERNKPKPEPPKPEQPPVTKPPEEEPEPTEPEEPDEE